MDSLTLYRTILELVVNSQVHFHEKRCLMTFVWAIVGVLKEKCVHLSRWVNHRPGEAQAASKQRQFARWLENEKIQAATIYRKLAQKALASWIGEYIYLALDSNSLWDRFVIVRVALIYRGRALPLSWMVMKHASSTVAFEDYQPILKDAAAILPPGCCVILLVDRGFDDNDLFCLARDLGWSFRIRLKRSLRVYRASKPSTNIGRLMPEKGKALFLHKVWLTDRFFGPVYLALAHVQARNGLCWLPCSSVEIQSCNSIGSGRCLNWLWRQFAALPVRVHRISNSPIWLVSVSVTHPCTPPDALIAVGRAVIGIGGNLCVRAARIALAGQPVEHIGAHRDCAT